MRVTAGFLQINLHTKPTLRVTLQTKLQYSRTLKRIVHRLPYIVNSITFIQALEYENFKNAYTPAPFAIDKCYGSKSYGGREGSPAMGARQRDRLGDRSGDRQFTNHVIVHRMHYIEYFICEHGV